MPQFSTIQSIFLVVSSVILFIYGLQHFSKEIQAWGSHRLNAFLVKWTRFRLSGFLLGAVATGLIQSSSAVSAIVVALVDAGTLTFAQSLTVLIGSNVGTVVTAQLVAFKLTGIGPIFIVIGFFFGLIGRIKIAGKSIFYFGFILFALDLISTSLGSLNSSFNLREFLLLGNSIPSGIIYGAALTMLVQSSSVTTGLILLLVQEQMIGLSVAAPMILGANIGTTSTGLIASFSMNQTAKMAAVANLLFNVIGVILFLPFLGPIVGKITAVSSNPVHAVAQVHLWFNLITALFFLICLTPFRKLVLWVFEKYR